MLEAGLGAHAVGDLFEEGLGAEGFGECDLHLCGHALGDLAGHVLAGGDGEVEDAAEEGLDDVQILRGEAGDGVGGELDEVGTEPFFDAWGGVEGLGEGAAGVQGEGLVFAAFVHDEGAGDEVSEALLLAVAEDADDADQVTELHVDDAQEVAREGFEEGDLAAGVLDDADLQEALAGRLAVPEGLEEGEVAPEEKEEEEHDEGHGPLVAESWTAGADAAGMAFDPEAEESEGKKEEEDGDELDPGVGEDGEETAADPGDGQMQIDLLRRFDVKLVRKAGLSAHSRMVSNRWIAVRKENWTRLEGLLERVQNSGLKALSGGELRELGLLYRQTAADLSAVRSDATAKTLETYLNRLVSRAHNFVYTGKKLGFATVWRFLSVDYPRLFRRLFGYTAFSTVVFLGGVLLGAIVTALKPQFMHTFLGPQMIATIEQHKMWTDSIVAVKPQASSAIMTNNLSVCFATFAMGVFAGLFTLYSLFNNGLLMGVLSVACQQNHMALNLWSFIAAHGALELPAIFLSGAAGLRLATGLLFPGVLPRKEALAVAGGEAIRLVAGTIPMLVVAGLLEAFLSPTGAPVAAKFAVCAVLLTGLGFWLSEGGRDGVPVAGR